PSADAQSYVVARDGRTLTSSDTGHTYKDTKPQPATTYRYQVVAVGADGVRSKPATVTVSTHVPPLDEARFSGSFVTKLHITSQSNLKSGVSGNTRLFKFAPHCGKGACSVTWSEKGLTGSGTLNQNGTHYAGTISAPFGISSCFGARVSETLVFNIKITHA